MKSPPGEIRDWKLWGQRKWGKVLEAWVLAQQGVPLPLRDTWTTFHLQLCCWNFLLINVLVLGIWCNQLPNYCPLPLPQVNRSCREHANIAACLLPYIILGFERLEIVCGKKLVNRCCSYMGFLAAFRFQCGPAEMAKRVSPSCSSTTYNISTSCSLLPYLLLWQA